MNGNASLPTSTSSFEIDIKRTERLALQNETFYWEDDVLVHAGQRRFAMGIALAQLSHAIKASFKQHIIFFTQQGNYSPHSYAAFFSALMTTLSSHPTSIFDVNWIAHALTNPSFRRYKKGITKFFLHWKERDSTAITQDALRLLSDAAACRPRPRNVLSDNPEKSWLTNEEYDDLLNVIWNNFDSGVSGTQVTLIRLLSMQYGRRPIQIAHLKVGDIRECDDPDSRGLTGCIVDFPGVKDLTAETGFRDSKFEPHQLADHLWNLCQVQIHEVRVLYEHTLGFPLTDDQLKKMPLFCSELRIKQARRIIEDHLQFNLLEVLDSKLFHLRKAMIGRVISWSENTPTCEYGVEKRQWSLRPTPPVSSRTGRIMIVTATRMRHTRARQLARQDVPKHILSYWLGHTHEKSLNAYYNDPAEQARQLDEAMSPALLPLAMAFAGKLIDSEDQASRASDPTSKLEFAKSGELKNVGSCGKHSFCATTSIPIPCYRCKHFEPLVDAPHQEVLESLLQRQAAEKRGLKIRGLRNLLIPIDLSADIHAVENCIARCTAHKAEREMKP